jgi:hypothetical protein
VRDFLEEQGCSVIRALSTSPPTTVDRLRRGKRRQVLASLWGLSVIAAWTLSFAGCGEAQSSGTDEPLVWEGPLAEKVDYLVGDGRPALVRYSFSNASKERVRFIEAKASCRCTSVELPKEDFPQGSSGAITFRLGIDDTPGHLVSSEGYVGYSCGNRNYAHVVRLAVNKRRPLEWVPRDLVLEEIGDAPSSHCQGWLELTRYTTPGHPFRDYRFAPSSLEGGASIVEDSGWGPVEQDAGYRRSTRRMLIRTKPNAPTSGTARLNLAVGDPPIGEDSVRIRWSRQNAASIEPETVLLSADRPNCRVHIVGQIGTPRDVSWKVPSGIEVVRSGDSQLEGDISVLLSLSKSVLKSKYPLTEPFTVVLNYGDHSSELAGTIVVLSAP